MRPEELTNLEQRKAQFDEFYEGLIPSLVEFIDRLGIRPAHEVLNKAAQYASYLSSALKDMEVHGQEDRTWLLTRMGYFIGEYFAQKYGGAWYTNEQVGSRFFARYVVGNFSKLKNSEAMIDPFQVAQVYVDMKPPRDLEALLSKVDAELSA